MKKRILPIFISVFLIAAGSYYFGSQQKSGKDIVNQPSRSAVSSIVQATDKPAETSRPVKSTKTYVLNKNTKKFHYPNCPSVKQMLEKNKEVVNSTREEIISDGYSPCGRCHP